MQLQRMYYILEFMDFTINSRVTYLFTTLTSTFASLTWTLVTLTFFMGSLWQAFTLTLLTPTRSLPQLLHTGPHSNSAMLTLTTDLLAPTTLTYSLSQLWYASSHCSDTLTITSLIIWLRWGQGGSGRMLPLTSLTLWLRWEQAGSGGSVFAGRGVTCFAGSGGMLTLTSLTIWLRWGQPGSGGSGFAGRGETAFAGSSGCGLDLASLVTIDLTSNATVDAASLRVFRGVLHTVYRGIIWKYNTRLWRCCWWWWWWWSWW